MQSTEKPSGRTSEQASSRADALTPADKALHSWSLFRTLGRFVAPGSMPSGGLPEGDEGGLALLDLPAELAARGYRGVQLCHFYLPTRDPGYLAELKAAFAAAGVLIECVLIDDGDLAHPSDSGAQRDWLSSWVDTAAQLEPSRVRVPAGQQPPTAENLARSADRLTELADRHPEVRVVVENWKALLPDAASTLELLDRTEGRIGFLVDLGNWKGPGKYVELAAVAGRAETCQAKVGTDGAGTIDEVDYRRSLEVLRDAGYAGPLAMVYDGADPDEWGKLEEAQAVLRRVFPG